MLYPLQKSKLGYKFVTDYGSEYEIYFTQLLNYGEHISMNGLNPNDFYYFGFTRSIKGKKCRQKDVFIKRTIAFSIFEFFTQHPDAIIVFNYSAGDGRLQARRKKFKEWFDEYSENTIIKMFQHDFAGMYTVCAIYKRKSHPAFEKVQENIELLVKNIEDSK